MTDKPFGVNIPLIMPERFKVAKVCQEEGIKVLNTSIGNPAEILSWAKEAGIKVIHTCGSLNHALKLSKYRRRWRYRGRVGGGRAHRFCRHHGADTLRGR